MDSRLDLNIDSMLLQKRSGEGPQKPSPTREYLLSWEISAKNRVKIQLSLCERHVCSGSSPWAGHCRVRTWEVTGLAQADLTNVSAKAWSPFQAMKL